MEAEGSLQHSQEPAAIPCSEPDQSSYFPQPTSWKSSLILSPPPKSGSSKWPLSFRFPRQNPLYKSPAPHTPYVPHAAHCFK